MHLPHLLFETSEAGFWSLSGWKEPKLPIPLCLMFNKQLPMFGQAPMSLSPSHFLFST